MGKEGGRSNKGVESRIKGCISSKAPLAEREEHVHMQKFQRITRTSLRRPKGIAFTNEQREQPGLVSLLLDAMKIMTRWRSLPLMLFLAVTCFGFFCQTNAKAQEKGFLGAVLQNNAASYVVRTDDGWLLDAEWDSGYDDWSPGDRVILTTDEGEGYMFNENNRTQVDVFPYDPSEIDF